MELCHQVDQWDKDDDALQVDALSLLENLTQSYMIERNDSQVIFLDGNFCTASEQDMIHSGIMDLSPINPPS